MIDRRYIVSGAGGCRVLKRVVMELLGVRVLYHDSVPMNALARLWKYTRMMRKFTAKMLSVR